MENPVPINRKQTEDFISITDLWHLSVAHWHWFVVSIAICLSFAFYYLAITPNQYTREAAILVKQEAMGKNAGRNTGGEDFNDIALVHQQTNVVNVQRQLTSLEVLTEVVRRLKLVNNDHEVILKAQDILKNLTTSIDDEKSTIINLKYVASSPGRAENVLNTVVQVFNEKWIEEKNRINNSTSYFILERLQLLEKDLGSVDDSISRFKIQNGITDLGRVSDMYLQQQSQSEAEILRLTNQMAMAKYILDILRNKSTQHQLLPTNSGLGNSVAESQIAHYNSMLLQMKNNMYSTSEQNPLIIKQEADLNDIRKNIFATIDNQIKTLDIQLQSLQGYSGMAKSKISSNPNQAKHLVSVEREQKVKESLYLYLLQKKEENEISMTYNSSITQMIDMPHGSDSPTSPNKRNVLFAAIMLGILVPVVIIFVRENMDSTVRDKHDVEKHTSLSLIGDIPLYIYKKKRNELFTRLMFWKKAPKQNPLVVEAGRQDMVNEAFRLIRTNIEFMTPKRGENNVYIVTSSYEGSGKTFVSMNLAITLAIKNRKVLLIDGDLRHASASRNFGNPRLGLADYLGENENDIHKLIECADNLTTLNSPLPTLDILPVGTVPPNPTELLASERFGEILKELRYRYDFIIIDCPPSESLADVGIIERLADRTLFVIRAGLFERNHVEDLDVEARTGKYKHLSIILNGTQTGGIYGVGRYGYGYGYYYGYHKG